MNDRIYGLDGYGKLYQKYLTQNALYMDLVKMLGFIEWDFLTFRTENNERK